MGYLLLTVLLVFIVVILYRTIKFKPIKKQTRNKEIIKFDEEESIKTLQKLITYKTISRTDKALEDSTQFKKLVNALPKLYPNVYKNLELKKFDGYALLFHWKGKTKGNPAVFMAHYDVVPVDEENWSKPAFEGLIEDGVLWGRGTLDTKVTFNGVLSACENLLKQKFKPKHDIYFAFSGGEEIGGPGAKNIVDYFKKNNITPAFVLDEGGAVVEGVFPGLNKACGLVGIAEKGSMDINLTVKSNGGHASAPKPHTPIGILAKACANIEAHPFKMQLSDAVLKMFDNLGRSSTFLYRMIFANLWCFAWILDISGRKSGGQINALMRTTVAFTQMKGSDASNVIPPCASMSANLRLSPGDSVDSAYKYIKSLVKDKNIEVTVLHPSEPSKVSETDSNGYKYIEDAIEKTWDCVCAPYLMVQCSDSKNYDEISNHVYRFSATDMTSDEINSIHGNDEHIRLSTIKKSVEFFIRVMKNC